MTGLWLSSEDVPFPFDHGKIDYVQNGMARNGYSAKKNSPINLVARLFYIIFYTVRRQHFSPFFWEVGDGDFKD